MTQQPGSSWSRIIQYRVEMCCLKGVKKVASSIPSWKKTRSITQRTWLLQTYHTIVMMAISTSCIYLKAGQSLCIISPGIYLAQCPVSGSSQSELLGEKYPTEQKDCDVSQRVVTLYSIALGACSFMRLSRFPLSSDPFSAFLSSAVRLAKSNPIWTLCLPFPAGFCLKFLNFFLFLMDIEISSTPLMILQTFSAFFVLSSLTGLAAVPNFSHCCHTFLSCF